MFACSDLSKRLPRKQNPFFFVNVDVFFCQVYDENDYRRARFTGRQKEVRSYLLKCTEDGCIIKISHKPERGFSQATKYCIQMCSFFFFASLILKNCKCKLQKLQCKYSIFKFMHKTDKPYMFCAAKL